LRKKLIFAVLEQRLLQRSQFLKTFFAVLLRKIVSVVYGWQSKVDHWANISQRSANTLLRYYDLPVTPRTNALGLLRIVYRDEHSCSEFPESMRPNQTNERVPSQTMKGGLAELPPSSLSGLRERLLRIPQETKETTGTIGNEASVRTGS